MASKRGIEITNRLRSKCISLAVLARQERVSHTAIWNEIHGTGNSKRLKKAIAAVLGETVENLWSEHHDENIQSGITDTDLEIFRKTGVLPPRKGVCPVCHERAIRACVESQRETLRRRAETQNPKPPVTDEQIIESQRDVMVGMMQNCKSVGIDPVDIFQQALEIIEPDAMIVVNRLPPVECDEDPAVCDCLYHENMRAAEASHEVAR